MPTPAKRPHPVIIQHDQRYHGVPILKNPFDLWAEMQLMQQRKPTVVVECGTYCGGSALYYIHNSDARVISVDLNVEQWLEAQKVALPSHPRITYIHGRSSTHPDVVEAVRAGLNPSDKVMVILDSCHFANHVLEELELYAPLVSVGQSLVVEDSFLDPVDGPLRAIQKFFGTAEGRKFERDMVSEEFFGRGLTYNPMGWWRRIAT